MRVFIAMGLIVVGIWCLVAFAYALYVSFGWFAKFFHGVVGFHRSDDRRAWKEDGRWHCRCKVCKKVLVLDEIGEWVTKE